MERVDAAVQFVGLLVRASVYGGLVWLAGHYDCGRAILSGMLFGDLAASVGILAMQGRDSAVRLVADIALIGLIALWVRADLVMPEEQAQRAIAALAALGMFSTRVGGGMLTRFGAE